MVNQDKEILRHAVLECLTSRHPVPLTAAGVWRRVRTEMTCPVGTDDVQGALEVLKGLGLVEETVDALGTSVWWRATSQGVLAVERAGRTGTD